MKIKVLMIVAGLALAVFAMPALANTEKSQEFVKKAAMSNIFEIRSSKIAVDKAQRQDVRQFAQEMIDDHTKAGNGLKAALSSSKLGTGLINYGFTG